MSYVLYDSLVAPFAVFLADSKSVTSDAQLRGTYTTETTTESITSTMTFSLEASNYYPIMLI